MFVMKFCHILPTLYIVVLWLHVGPQNAVESALSVTLSGFVAGSWSRLERFKLWSVQHVLPQHGVHTWCKLEKLCHEPFKIWYHLDVKLVTDNSCCQANFSGCHSWLWLSFAQVPSGCLLHGWTVWVLTDKYTYQWHLPLYTDWLDHSSLAARVLTITFGVSFSYVPSVWSVLLATELMLKWRWCSVIIYLNSFVFALQLFDEYFSPYFVSNRWASILNEWLFCVWFQVFVNEEEMCIIHLL